MRSLSKASKTSLVKCLAKIRYNKDQPPYACQKGKKIKCPHKIEYIISTSRSFELIHLGLFDSHNNTSLNVNKYYFVIVDDFSHFAGVFFIKNKYSTLENSLSFAKD